MNRAMIVTATAMLTVLLASGGWASQRGNGGGHGGSGGNGGGNGSCGAREMGGRHGNGGPCGDGGGILDGRYRWGGPGGGELFQGRCRWGGGHGVGGDVGAGDAIRFRKRHRVQRDADADGTPNGQDPDFTPGVGFVDEDGDGICDLRPGRTDDPTESQSRLQGETR